MQSPVDRLEKLAALHRRGNLGDAAFAAAKESVLDACEESERPDHAGMAVADARSSHGGSVHTTAGAWPGASRRAPFWRNPWALGVAITVAIFCGFMYAAVATAVIPSSALWTGRLACSSPAHLVSHRSRASFGNSTQMTVRFTCVDPSGASKRADTFAIFGLQLALGAGVSLGLIAVTGLVSAGIARRRR
ncbi:MAG TPA: hypothetical protein VKV26_00775 [Dehalococcoidia bacterium]|nr:hypothetical protein [Dehalococcoidia bacterium]